MRSPPSRRTLAATAAAVDAEDAADVEAGAVVAPCSTRFLPRTRADAGLYIGAQLIASVQPMQSSEMAPTASN